MRALWARATEKVSESSASRVLCLRREDAHEDRKGEDECADDDALSVGAVGAGFKKFSKGWANDEKGKSAQPDHLFDGPARATDADVGLLEVLVRVLQLHPLSDQTPEHFLPDLFVLEREAVRVFEPLRTRVERLGRLEEAGALGGRVGEGVDVVVVCAVVIIEGIRGMGRSGGKEEISICHGSERGLAGDVKLRRVSSSTFTPISTLVVTVAQEQKNGDTRATREESD